MEEFIGHLEFAKILGIVAIITITLTIITFLVFRSNRVVKYLPGIILILIGLYNLLYLDRQSSTINGINKIFIILVTMIGGFIGLSTGLIIGIIKKGKE